MARPVRSLIGFLVLAAPVIGILAFGLPGEGVIRLRAAGIDVEVSLGTENGAVVLPDLFGFGDVVVVGPRDGDPWRFTGVSISPTGMTIDAIVDANRVLAGS
jgi:hypothetical protein